MSDMIVFDTETTGINAPEIVSAAWADVEWPSLKSINEFWAFYQPSKPIEYGAMAIHGLRNVDLELCQLSSDFSLPADVKYIVGHNVDYDWAAIGSPSVKRICTLALSRALWPFMDSFSLGALIYMLEPERAKEILYRAHSAIVDVRTTVILLRHILDAIPHIVDHEGLWLASEAARLPKIMTFGKYKGMLLHELPSSYVSWLLKQPDLEPYLERALQAL